MRKSESMGRCGGFVTLEDDGGEQATALQSLYRWSKTAGQALPVLSHSFYRLATEAVHDYVLRNECRVWP